MQYEFDQVIDRRGTGSVKWDVGANELPMWVADMDFRTAPEILEAIEARAAHGVFGYSILPDAWYDAYIGWWRERHGLTMERDWLVFCTGVVPAISSIVRKLTTPNENVLIQTPVYNIFFNSIVNNGCRVLENRLKYENGAYSMDFDDLEKKLSNPQTTLMILCNPHNPIGKIWDRETLRRIGELCRKHSVTVIADEIHCDLTLPGKEYVPFASASEACRDICITCLAPTKTFNLAGMQSAAVAVPNPVLRHKVWRALNTDEIAEPNAFAVTAAVAAFTRGGPWLDALRAYLAENRKQVRDFLERELPEVHLVDGEATYLLWLDLGEGASEFCSFLRRETGLFVSKGAAYGETGENFLRVNIACPRVTLEDGLQRLKRGVELWRQRSR